jgi:hypothetical protein
MWSWAELEVLQLVAKQVTAEEGFKFLQVVGQGLYQMVR